MGPKLGPRLRGDEWLGVGNVGKHSNLFCLKAESLHVGRVIIVYGNQMSITDKNAVFIIGAGSSAIFGMPLGAGLIEEIATKIGQEIKEETFTDQCNRIVRTSSLDGYSVARTSSNGDEDYDKYSIASAEYLYLKSKGGQNNHHSIINKVEANLKKLMTLLNNQTSDTIDDFIVENEEVAQLTKVCIATIFIQKLYERQERPSQLTFKNLSKRSFKVITKNKKSYFERNWVHHFINLVRKAVQAGEVSPENKVKVISFNYDNILEYVLTKQFQNTGYEYEAWGQYIEIIHPHGQCGLPPETIANPAALAIEWAKGIFVVNEQTEKVSEQVMLDREKAKEWIAQSGKIYSLGFAFSGPNLRLLGLDPSGTPEFYRLISYCNYDGNIGLTRNLLRFKRDKRPVQLKTPHPSGMRHLNVSVNVEEAKGDRDNPMGCSDWFKLGYPGELPS